MTASVPQQRRPLPQPQLVGTDVSQLDRRADRVAEQKWDGWRGLLDAGAGRLLSRHGTDLTGAFPDVLEAAADLGDVVLDGELVCLTGGRDDFDRVSARGVCTGRAAARRAVADPAVLVVWDVLRVDDRNLMPLPWTERRAALLQLGLTDDISAGGIAVTTVFDDVPALLQATFDLGLEGVVAKLPTARYAPGRRTNDWVKCKNPAHPAASRGQRAWRRTA